MTANDAPNDDQHLLDSCEVYICAKTSDADDSNDHFHLNLGFVPNDPNRTLEDGGVLQLILSPGQVEMLLGAFTQAAARYGGVLNARAGQPRTLAEALRRSGDDDINLGPFDGYLRSL